jgi:hypothetical protein
MSKLFKGEFSGSDCGTFIFLARNFKSGELASKLEDCDFCRRNLPAWMKENWSSEKIIEKTDRMRELIKGIKWFKPEEIRLYKIWGWGYDQTNYENLEIVGEKGAYFVAKVHDWNWYKIPKSVGSGFKRKDGTVKDHYSIDSSRTTSWETPYASKEIDDQNRLNTFCGH